MTATNRLSLLLIEEDGPDRQLAKVVLSSSLPDCQVTVAGSGSELFEAIEARRYDAVVTQLGLEEVRSSFFMKTLRALLPDAALLLFVRKQESAAAQLAVDSGTAAGFLVKEPQGFLDLPDTVTRAVAARAVGARDERPEPGETVGPRGVSEARSGSEARSDAETHLDAEPPFSRSEPEKGGARRTVPPAVASFVESRRYPIPAPPRPRQQPAATGGPPEARSPEARSLEADPSSPDRSAPNPTAPKPTAPNPTEAQRAHSELDPSELIPSELIPSEPIPSEPAQIEPIQMESIRIEPTRRRTESTGVEPASLLSALPIEAEPDLSQAPSSERRLREAPDPDETGPVGARARAAAPEAASTTLEAAAFEPVPVEPIPMEPTPREPKPADALELSELETPVEESPSSSWRTRLTALRGPLIVLALLAVLVLVFLALAGDGTSPSDGSPPDPSTLTEPSTPTDPSSSAESASAPASATGPSRAATAPEATIEAGPQESAGGAKSGAPITLELRAIDEVWVALEVDGRPVTDVILRNGQVFTAEGQESAFLQIGNAAGLTVLWNGNDLGPLGDSGQVRRLEFTPTEVRPGTRRP